MKNYTEFAAALAADPKADPSEYGVYAASVNAYKGGTVYMADAGEADVLCAEPNPGFSGEMRDGVLVAALTHANADALRAAFPFTAPVRVLGRKATMGVGDRLGIAGDGHIRVFEGCDLSPVLAQQSMRELKLTSRTYADVIDASTFSVYRMGWRGGFGADGDHLKTLPEIEGALKAGCTMITLDCSDYIVAEGAHLSDVEVSARCLADPALEALYLDKTFEVGGVQIAFTPESLRRARLIYGRTIDFSVEVYEAFFAGENAQADFEMSIDETTEPTTPEQHYFIASELIRRGVKPVTIAPRFCGEFQKGVDYRGDLAQFERELAAHAAIAKHFDYKLSIHSGSDKFSVFPLIGRYTEGRFHVKTAGTNWLEAMRIVAECDPALYREVHALALRSFDEARKYYHVTTNLANIPPLDSLRDDELPNLFSNEDARQLIHITYGLILADASVKERLYKLWRHERKAYSDALYRHIGRHVTELTGISLRGQP